MLLSRDHPSPQEGSAFQDTQSSQKLRKESTTTAGLLSLQIILHGMAVTTNDHERPRTTTKSLFQKIVHRNKSGFNTSHYDTVLPFSPSIQVISGSVVRDLGWWSSSGGGWEYGCASQPVSWASRLAEIRSVYPILVGDLQRRYEICSNLGPQPQHVTTPGTLGVLIISMLWQLRSRCWCWRVPVLVTISSRLWKYFQRRPKWWQPAGSPIFDGNNPLKPCFSVTFPPSIQIE